MIKEIVSGLVNPKTLIINHDHWYQKHKTEAGTIVTNFLANVLKEELEIQKTLELPGNRFDDNPAPALTKLKSMRMKLHHWAMVAHLYNYRTFKNPSVVSFEIPEMRKTKSTVFRANDLISKETKHILEPV